MSPNWEALEGPGVKDVRAGDRVRRVLRGVARAVSLPSEPSGNPGRVVSKAHRRRGGHWRDWGFRDPRLGSVVRDARPLRVHSQESSGWI